MQRKETEDEAILAIIKPVFEKHKSRYGYRRVQSEAKSELKGVNHKRIQRIMRENELFGKQPKHKYHSYKGDDGESKENLLLDKIVDEQTSVVTLERNFTTTAPNQKWTTDVSMFKISAGKLYLSPIMDMYDHSIISYDISINPDFKQTKRMINRALNQFDDLKGLVKEFSEWCNDDIVIYTGYKEEEIKALKNEKIHAIEDNLIVPPTVVEEKKTTGKKKTTKTK